MVSQCPSGYQRKKRRNSAKTHDRQCQDMQMRMNDNQSIGIYNLKLTHAWPWQFGVDHAPAEV
eukprot:6185275-Pleurochrysis_carterae.AAC.1